MRTVVIGTAGHIDHGKTTLLRALTGIDADRLPEERQRGMTIDVGFAHLDLDDGTSLDFVDVPGHDRLVGNMLVGAGEIDAVLLVVAADDGPRAQTLEHLELLDALGLRHAVVAITKTDTVDPVRVDEVVATTRALVARTSFAGARVVRVSAASGAGVAEVREGLVGLRDAALADLASGPSGPTRLAVDRAFAVRGRGLVVTGTLRGGTVAAGDVLRLVPCGGEARVREVQVHHGRAARADGGRAAVNLAGLDVDAIRRGMVLTSGPGVESSDRLLVSIRPALALAAAAAAAGAAAGARSRAWHASASAVLRLHLWTETVDASIRPAGSTWPALPDDAVAALIRLAHPIALSTGARGVLRDPGSGQVIGGVTVLDTQPPRGPSRRRLTPGRIATLAAAVASATLGARPENAGAENAGEENAGAENAASALTEIHGALSSVRLGVLAGALASPPRRPSATVPDRARHPAMVLAPDVAAALSDSGTELVGGRPTLAELRAALLRRLRRLATISRDDAPLAVIAIDGAIDGLIGSGRAARDGDRVVRAASGETRRVEAEQRSAALVRLEAALDVDVPPSLAQAAQGAGAPSEAIAALERTGRIVRVDDDLAWATARYASLRDRAVALARVAPLTPAAFRDAIGGNRRIALAFLEDLGRKGVLRRTDAGHVPGPRA